MDTKEILIQLAKQIRDERGLGANTATRVGSLFLAMVEFMGEGEFLHKDKEDVTQFLLECLGGLVVEQGLKADSLEVEGNTHLSGTVEADGLGTFNKGLVAKGNATDSISNALIEENGSTGDNSASSRLESIILEDTNPTSGGAETLGGLNNVDDEVDSADEGAYLIYSEEKGKWISSVSPQKLLTYLLSGGWKEAASEEEMNALDTSSFRNGCVCCIPSTSDGDDKLFIWKNGAWVSTSFGGGGNSSVDMRLTTLSAQTQAVISGDSCMLKFSFSSVYTSDSTPTGSGTVVYKVNNATVKTDIVSQGSVSFDVSGYLVTGTNSVTITVLDAAGNSRTLSYVIEVVLLRLEDIFDSSGVFEGEIIFNYKPVGAVSKTVHFLIDDVEVATTVTSYSNRELTKAIPAQPHGAHLLSVYITATVNGLEAQSETLSYALICIEKNNTTPIIASAFAMASATQYETLAIPFRVYDPSQSTTLIVLKVNGTILSEQTVDRTEQTWQYRLNNIGTTELIIACGAISKTFTVNVMESEISVKPETEGLQLWLTSANRSNNDSNKTVWSYEGISAALTGFNYSTNGWVSGIDETPVLRINGGARAYIPFLLFEEDFRATGKTIEFEFSTSNVLDFESIVISCFSDNIGIKISPQKAIFKSEGVSTETIFKEEERVRVSFVVEKRTDSRLLYTYLNGILSGVTQYATGDNFQQLTAPVGITLGNDLCTLDVYNLRIYRNNLSRFQMLDNYIGDLDDFDTKYEVFSRNQIFNDYGDLVYDYAVSRIPCMTFIGELPNYKGDKKTTTKIVYENRQDPTKSFYTGFNVTNDVQGTSSQYYPRKNYKFKFHKTEGLTMVQSGNLVKKYKLRDSSIGATTFTVKADFAESSGTHNTGLAKIIENTQIKLGLLTPPQQLQKEAGADINVRTTVDGFPILIFHKATEEDSPEFIGKYNFNNDKSSADLFGFVQATYPDCQSWEFLNNNSGRVRFLSSDFDEVITDSSTGESYAAWTDDFEARFPDDDALNAQYAAGTLKPLLYKRLTDWIVSTIGDTEKFKSELSLYFNVDFLVFYYVITELLGMVDQRAKNMFATTWDGQHWYFIFYDNDTCLGLDNNGLIKFSYQVEYHDKVNGANVWNDAAQSTLWNNLEATHASEIAAMYAKVVGVLKYSDVLSMLNTEQSDKWCEAIYNLDGYYKYILPLIDGYYNAATGQVEKTSEYLERAQGSRQEHRKWWVYNRFKYLNSKYNCDDYLGDYVTMRINVPTLYTGDNLTSEQIAENTKIAATLAAVPADMSFDIVPYVDQYCTVKYENTVKRIQGYKGTTAHIEAPNMSFNDTNTILYGASRLLSLGDLSNKYASYVVLTSATKLSELRIGNGTSGYRNNKLVSLSIGQNKMLRLLDIRNCPNLTQNVDISGCTNIEKIYAKGSSIVSLNLPIAGNLNLLQLPETLTNLTLKNQLLLADEAFSLAGVGSLSTIVIEKVPGINLFTILKACFALPTLVLTRCRLIGIHGSGNDLTVLTKLISVAGLDENGNNTKVAVVTGTWTVDSIDIFTLEALNTSFPELIISYTTLYTPKTRLTFVSSKGHAFEKEAFTCSSVAEERITKVSSGFYDIVAPVGTLLKYTFRTENHVESIGNITSQEATTGDTYLPEEITVTYIPTRSILAKTGGGAPISGASVWVNEVLQDGVTNSNGYFLIATRTSAALSVKIGGLDDYSTETVALPIATDDSTDTIVLKAKMDFTFIVRSQLGSTLSGAAITCNGSTKQTDNSGAAVFKLFPGNTYTYSLTYNEVYKSGSIEATTTTPSVIVELTLSIVDMQPVSNGNIQLMFSGTTIGIAITSMSAKHVIDWGDGKTETGTTGGAVGHTYSDGVSYHSIEISNCEDITYCQAGNSYYGTLIAYWSIGSSKVSGLSFNWMQALVAVGSDLFKNDAARTSMYQCFYGDICLEKIGDGLFDALANVTNFSWCFLNCEKLKAIPTELFKYCYSAVTFETMFSQCAALTGDFPHLIASDGTWLYPWDQYDGAHSPYPLATKCARAFYSCTGLNNYNTFVAATKSAKWFKW